MQKANVSMTDFYISSKMSLDIMMFTDRIVFALSFFQWLKIKIRSATVIKEAFVLHYGKYRAYFCLIYWKMMLIHSSHHFLMSVPLLFWISLTFVSAFSPGPASTLSQ